jgi:ABC-type glycerol-3-phosphate transport system substrate-binding protein
MVDHRRSLTRGGLLRGRAAPLGASVLLGACARAAAPSGPATAVATPRKVTHADWFRPGADPLLGEYVEGVSKDFADAHPGVTVEWVYGDPTAAVVAGVQQKVITMLAGGTPPDSLQVSVTFMLDWQQKELIVPLDPYMARKPEVAMGKFVDSGRLTNVIAGKSYGIPFDGPSAACIVINTAQFKEAGLNPDRSVTWNWDWGTFLEAAKKLARKQGSDFTRMAWDPRWDPFDLQRNSYWLYPNGGQIYTADLKKVAINSKEGIDSLQFKADLLRNAELGQIQGGGGFDGMNFEAEQIAMRSSGTFAAGAHSGRNAALQFDFVPFPKGPSGKRPGGTTWMNGWALLKDSREKDLAWEWMSFVNGQAMQEKYFAGVLRRVSPRKDVFTSTAWQALVKATPALKDADKLADMAGAYPYVRTDDVNTALKPVWQSLADQQVGVAAALTQAEMLANQVLSR